MGTFSKKQALFQRRLETLRKILAHAPRVLRLEAIEALSNALRLELLRLFEARGKHRDAARNKSKVFLGISKKSSAMSSSERRQQHFITISSAQKRQVLFQEKTSSGGLWTMHTKSGVYHAARLSIGGIVMATRTTRCLTEAYNLRAALHRLADRARSDCQQGTRMLHSSTAPLSSHDTFERGVRNAIDAEGKQLGLTFCLVLDLRSFVGKKVQSPVTASFDDALNMRRDISEASMKGWPSLRQLWRSWLTTHRPRSRWKSIARSVDEAELVIAAAECSFASIRQSHIEVREQQLASTKAKITTKAALKDDLRQKHLQRRCSKMASRIQSSSHLAEVALADLRSFKPSRKRALNMA